MEADSAEQPAASFIHADFRPEATQRGPTIAERSSQRGASPVVEAGPERVTSPPGLIANQWSWLEEYGGDNNHLGPPYINHSCTVPNTNYSGGAPEMMREILSLLHRGDVIDSPPLRGAAAATGRLFLPMAANALACGKTGDEILGGNSFIVLRRGCGASTAAMFRAWEQSM